MWGGGQLCRDICLCAWGTKNRHAFFLMLNARLVDMVAIEWNVGLFSICYTKGCNVCKLHGGILFTFIWYYYNFHN